MTLRAGLAFALLVFGIDQMLKVWALFTLAPSVPIQLLGTPEAGLSAMLVRNPGIVFGMVLPVGNGPNLLVLLLVALVGVVLLARMLRSRLLVLNLGRGGVVGGAASNLLDRLRHGAVIDYLVVRRDDVGFAFNLADIAIVLGAALMLGCAATYALSSLRPA